MTIAPQLNTTALFAGTEVPHLARVGVNGDGRHAASSVDLFAGHEEIVQPFVRVLSRREKKNAISMGSSMERGGLRKTTKKRGKKKLAFRFALQLWLSDRIVRTELQRPV